MADDAQKHDDAQKQAPRGSKDLGQKEVQEKYSEADEQGFFGTKVDPFPNSAHSLESGPDSPTIAETREALAKQEADR